MLPDDAGAIAAALIDATGSLADVLVLKPQRLAEILPVGTPAATLILAVRRAMVQSLKTRALGGPIIRVGKDLLAYLHASLAHLVSEELRVLYLNGESRLIAESVVQYGTLHELALYPREIVIRALEEGAARIILVHNHPSGDPEPSPADRSGTMRIAAACRTVGIELVDHVIVGRAGATSFRALNLL